MTVRIGALVVSVALLAVLAGCAVTSTGVPGSSSPASTSPSPSSTSREQPRSALALTCASLLSLPKLQAHLADTVSVKIDETRAPRLLEEIAVLQAGGTECAWGGTDGTDAAWDTGVTLAILPNAATEFGAWEASPTRSLSGSFADASGFDCSPTSASGGDWCTGDALVGRYWVAFTVNDIRGSSGSGPTVTNAVMTDVVAAIRSAGPELRNGTPPVGSVTGAELCSSASAPGKVSAILGAPATASSYIPPADLLATAASRTGLVRCSWSVPPQESLGIATLPGGAWAYARLQSNPPAWTLIGSGAPIAVSGSDGSLQACGAACEAVVDVGGSLVEVDYSPNGDTAMTSFTPIVQKTIDAIRAG